MVEQSPCKRQVAGSSPVGGYISVVGGAVMIYHLQTSVLDTHAKVVAHQVNCMGVMGSGVASQVKRKYPEAYKAYKSYCDQNEHYRIGMLGSVQIVPVSFMPDGEPRIFVANLFAQFDYGRSKYTVYTNYTALRQCLHKLRDFSVEHEAIIALPWHIGCDRGNGDWDGHVYPMIQSILSDREVLLCEYPPKEIYGAY